MHILDHPIFKSSESWTFCTIALTGFFAAIALLQVIVPGKLFKGYAPHPTKKGEVLTYKLNGLRIYFISLIVSGALVYAGVFKATFIADNLWKLLFIANAEGLLLSFAFMIIFPKHDLWPSDKPKPGFLMDFYAGRILNPRIGMFDFKMWLYLEGAILLQLTVLSAAALQYSLYGAVTVSMYAYQGMLAYFLIDYLYNEDVHCFTYDLFAERIGFKLTWGCIVVYPFFYAVGVWPIIHLKPEETEVIRCVIGVVMFLTGAVLSRGANLQKFDFKINPNKPSVFGIKPKSIGGKLLSSGFWAMSRHINYLGELLYASGIALAGGFTSILPWLYPLYYVALLVPRERVDNDRCAAKYGKLWTQYCKQVPYRIIPYVY